MSESGPKCRKSFGAPRNAAFLTKFDVAISLDWVGRGVLEVAEKADFDSNESERDRKRHSSWKKKQQKEERRRGEGEEGEAREGGGGAVCGGARKDGSEEIEGSGRREDGGKGGEGGERVAADGGRKIDKVKGEVGGREGSSANVLPKEIAEGRDGKKGVATVEGEPSVGKGGGGGGKVRGQGRGDDREREDKNVASHRQPTEGKGKEKISNVPLPERKEALKSGVEKREGKQVRDEVEEKVPLAKSPHVSKGKEGAGGKEVKDESAVGTQVTSSNPSEDSMSGRGATKKGDGKKEIETEKGGKVAGADVKPVASSAKKDPPVPGAGGKVGKADEEKSTSAPVQKVTPVTSTDADKKSANGSVAKDTGSTSHPTTDKPPSVTKQEDVKAKKVEKKEVRPVSGSYEMSKLKEDKGGIPKAKETAPITSEREKASKEKSPVVSKDKTVTGAKEKSPTGTLRRKTSESATKIRSEDQKLVSERGKGEKISPTKVTPKTMAKEAEMTSSSKGVKQAREGIPSIELDASKTGTSILDSKKDKGTLSAEKKIVPTTGAPKHTGKEPEVTFPSKEAQPPRTIQSSTEAVSPTVGVSTTDIKKEKSAIQSEKKSVPTRKETGMTLPLKETTAPSKEFTTKVSSPSKVKSASETKADKAGGSESAVPSIKKDSVLDTKRTDTTKGESKSPSASQKKETSPKVKSTDGIKEASGDHISSKDGPLSGQKKSDKSDKLNVKTTEKSPSATKTSSQDLKISPTASTLPKDDKKDISNGSRKLTPTSKQPVPSRTPEEKHVIPETKGFSLSPTSKPSSMDPMEKKSPITPSVLKTGKVENIPKEKSPKTSPTKPLSTRKDKEETEKKDSQAKRPQSSTSLSDKTNIFQDKMEDKKAKSPTAKETKLNKVEVAPKETKDVKPVLPASGTNIEKEDSAQTKKPQINSESMKVDNEGNVQKEVQTKDQTSTSSSPKKVPSSITTKVPSQESTRPTSFKSPLNVQHPSRVASNINGAASSKSIKKEVDEEKATVSQSETKPHKESATKTHKKGTSPEIDKQKGSKEPYLLKSPSSEVTTRDRASSLHSKPDKSPQVSDSERNGQLSAERMRNGSSKDKTRLEYEKKPELSTTAKDKTAKQLSPTSPQEKTSLRGDKATGDSKESIRGEEKTKQPTPSKTPTEHKTIVQKLQEAREEALPRGERRNPDFREYSKSEIVLPSAAPNGARSDLDKQMTSSPNLKVQIGSQQKATDPKKHGTAKAECKSIDSKEISKSEAGLPSAVPTSVNKSQPTEKQMTSSPNLTAAQRHVSSVDGLPNADAIARSSPSVAVLNGMHRPHRASEKRDSRKGSIISDTVGIPDPVGARARSATWSQAAVPTTDARKEVDDASARAAAAAEAERDKRWSSAGSDILSEQATGRLPGKRGIICPAPIGAGKEWRSEGLSKALGSSSSNGVVAKVGSIDAIGRTREIARGQGEPRPWDSEAGLMKQATTKAQGFTKFDGSFPTDPKSMNHGLEFRKDRKDLVSPSSSTASKGSGIEKISEASGSYHSVASSMTRRDSKSESMVAREASIKKHMAIDIEDKQPDSAIESGDKVKLIDKEEVDGKYEGAEKEAGREQGIRRQGLEVECIVEVGNEKKNGRGSGKEHRGSGRKSPKSSRERHGVENQGADLERALEEEEEAAAAAGGRGEGPRLRPYIDLWDNEDKFSVANSQLPLNPSGEEDAGSIGSMLTTEPERGNWTGRFDFLLSLLGYSVGLGNVWRFPYLCYNNGGGAFLIPFTIMLVIAGLPLMFMELSFGQYANLGPAAIYSKFCPLFHGLGYGMVIVSTVVMLYYNLIIAWTIFYMFASLNKQLPWQNCEPEWSTLDCYSYEIADTCLDKNGTYYQRTCYNETEATANNISHLAEVAEKRPPAEEYFNNYVLGLSKGIEETGEIRLSMALCLLLAWAIVFLCLSKGVQSSGKVVYFTALFPYVVLIILFIRGVTLPGASTGILFYLTPDWKRLANAQVWGDAAVQIFFALSPAWGGLITLASYNKFSNNCYKDSLIVAVSNILTSFFAGFVIFSVIGFLAHELNVEVKKVVDQGAGLAFIVYPEVVTRLPVSPLWSLLFFVMLLTLGLDSQFALMETVTTAILDRFPNLREKKVWVVLVVAVLGYFGGLIFTTNSGMYWLQLMDKYAANWSVLLIAISECILIAWVYGADRFLRDVQEMIGPKSRLWMFFWCWMWKLVTPATLLFILFFNWVEYAPASYGEYIYPLWADAAGWVIGVFPVLVIIGAGVVKVYTAPEASIRERFKRLLQPTPDWGPAMKRSSAPPTYDSIRNTIVLMNGLPVIQETQADGESLEDNTL